MIKRGEGEEEETEVVVVEEALGDVRAKHDGDTAFAVLSAPEVFGSGISPQEVAHDALVGRLLVPVEAADLLQGDPVLLEEPSVAHKHLLVDHVGEGQRTEHLRKHLVRLL